MTFRAPQRGLKSFTCPHCHTLARHYHWGYASELNANARFLEETSTQAIYGASKCEHCEQFCLWHGKDLVYPRSRSAPVANAAMPGNVKADYEEAAATLGVSPRGAAALLRLSIQKLCIHLGGKGDNLNDDIAALVAKGLPVKVQQALDIVRVIGNNAVHPGLIVVDDTDTAVKLFPLVNVIVEYMIELPQRIGTMYDALPEGARKAIEKRDS